jgi:hypothetical protein
MDNDNEHRAPSFPLRLGVSLGVALLTALIMGGPGIGLFFLLWWFGGDGNLELAVIVAGLIGLAWMGLAGMKITMALVRRVHIWLWHRDIDGSPA